MQNAAATAPEPYDTSDLSVAITSEDARHYRDQHDGQPGFGGARRAISGATAAVIAYSLLGMTIEAVVVGLPAMTFFLGGLPIVAWLIAILLGGLVGWWYGRWARRRVISEFGAGFGWKRRARVARFAARNGFAYVPEIESPPVCGSVFGSGRHRRIEDLLADPDIEVGNYRTDERYVSAAAPSGWGFIRIRLDTWVPHLLVVSTRFSRLRLRTFIAVRESQRMTLEGDFERYFRVYAPDGYGRDALYVLAPNLMAQLIDRVPNAIVETIDDRLLICVPQPLRLDRAETWDWIWQVSTTVGRTGRRQTLRYDDERTPVRGFVDISGSRLRLGIPFASIVLVVWIALQLLRFIHF